MGYGCAGDSDRLVICYTGDSDLLGYGCVGGSDSLGYAVQVM